jgi:hypothetical protein
MDLLLFSFIYSQFATELNLKFINVCTGLGANPRSFLIFIYLISLFYEVWRPPQKLNIINYQKVS